MICGAVKVISMKRQSDFVIAPIQPMPAWTLRRWFARVNQVHSTAKDDFCYYVIGFIHTACNSNTHCKQWSFHLEISWDLLSTCDVSSKCLNTTVAVCEVTCCFSVCGMLLSPGTAQCLVCWTRTPRITWCIPQTNSKEPGDCNPCLCQAAQPTFKYKGFCS